MKGKIYGVKGTHLTSSCFTRKLSFPAMYSPAQQPGIECTCQKRGGYPAEPKEGELLLHNMPLGCTGELTKAAVNEVTAGVRHAMELQSIEASHARKPNSPVQECKCGRSKCPRGQTSLT